MTHLRLVTCSPDAAPRLPAHPLRRLAAAILRGTRRTLARMAHRVAQPAVPTLPLVPETLEFYADASAPEGALYHSVPNCVPSGSVVPRRLPSES